MGPKGLTLFREHAGEIDAVLLDQSMPGMDGVEVLQHIQHLRPDVRVLLCSGYNEQETVARLSGHRPSGFLRKPYLPEELIRQLRAVW